MNNLKKIREQKKLSQKDLAILSGVNLRMIQNYEQGVKDLEKANVTTIYKLTKALDCSIYTLLGWKELEEQIKEEGFEEYVSYMSNAEPTAEHVHKCKYMLGDYLYYKYGDYDTIFDFEEMIEKIIKEYKEV